MKPWLFPIMALLLACSGDELPAQGSEKQVGGRCEGCEATLEFGDRDLNSIDTLPDAGIDAPPLLLTGRVFTIDRKPAEGVIVYIHHTDQEGLYQLREDAEPWRNSGQWARRHGSLRGWVRSDDDGRYTFITQRPAAYPGRTDPAHIHMFIKEDGLSPYYIDDVLFDDDPLLTPDERDGRKDRGGSGIVEQEVRNDTIFIERDIILGLNVPGY